MLISRNLLLVAACAAAAATLGGCRKGDVSTSSHAGLAPEVSALQAEGAGPRLSWSPVAGATEYEVLAVPEVSGEGDLWVWVGRETEVEFGAIDLLTEEQAQELDLIEDRLHRRKRFVASKGTRYRWLVTAFDEQGAVIALSEYGQFTVGGEQAAAAPADAETDEE